MSALILLCRGPLGAEAVGQLRALQADVQQHLLNQYQAVGQQKLAVDAAYIDVVADTTSPMVQLAFIDRRAPSLPEALDACREHSSVRILPLLLPDEPALRRWLHKVVMRWRAAHHGGAGPRLVFADPLTHTVALPPLLAAAVDHALAQNTDVATVIGEDDWQRNPKGWSSVPDHQHHVLWCVGPRCAAKGALQMWPALTRAIRETPALKHTVQPLQTGCQFPCNHGPLMIAYPDGVWYGPMDEDSIAPVLTRHVRDREVDEAHHVHGPRCLDKR